MTPALLTRISAPPKSVRDAVGQRRDLLGLAHVHAQGERLARPRARISAAVSSARARSEQAGQDDARAAGSELERDRPADAARAARDDGGPHAASSGRDYIHGRRDRRRAVPAGMARVDRSIHRTIFESMSPGPTSR